MSIECTYKFKTLFFTTTIAIMSWLTQALLVSWPIITLKFWVANWCHLGWQALKKTVTAKHTQSKVRACLSVPSHLNFPQPRLVTFVNKLLSGNWQLILVVSLSQYCFLDNNSITMSVKTVTSFLINHICCPNTKPELGNWRQLLSLRRSKN